MTPTSLIGHTKLALGVSVEVYIFFFVLWVTLCWISDLAIP